MSRLDEIRGRLAAATPGPWQYLRGNSWDGASAVGTSDGHPLAFVGDPDAAGVDEDSTLMANAPTDLADLLAFAQEISDAWHGGVEDDELIVRIASALTKLGEV